MLRYFRYVFHEGPLPSEETLTRPWDVGNCRRAVQFYVWHKKGMFLRPEQVLCPEAYECTGEFVVRKTEPFAFDLLEDADILYAESIRRKNGATVDKSEDAFGSKEEYLVSLHTALFTGNRGREIWHATAIEGESCFWSLEKFLHFYRPIVAKRIIKNML